MDISFIICVALFLCFTFSIQGEKRILLNDPDVIAERLNRIEQKVTILETDNLQQKQTVTNLKAENLQLEQRLQQSSQLIHNLQSSVSKLQSMYSNIIIIRCSTNSLFLTILLSSPVVLFSYSAVWWGIVPNPTIRALYFTSQHFRKTIPEGIDINMFSA